LQISAKVPAKVDTHQEVSEGKGIQISEEVKVEPIDQVVKQR
jgi:hypothetical protein